MSELAMVTAKRSRLQALAARGSRRARFALRLADDPTAFLASVRVGITLIGILVGAFGGARVAVHVQPYIARVGGLASWSEEVAFGLVVAAITFASLILGELVPKRIALGAPERVAMMVRRPGRERGGHSCLDCAGACVRLGARRRGGDRQPGPPVRRPAGRSGDDPPHRHRLARS